MLVCRHDFSAIESHHDIGDTDHLLQIRGGHQQNVAALAEFAQKPINLCAGPDIDAAGRLVDENYAGGLAPQGARKKQFLLFSPAKVESLRPWAPGIDGNLTAKLIGKAAQAEP